MMDEQICMQNSKEIAALKANYEALDDRMSSVEDTTKSIHAIATSVAVLCQQMEYMNSSVSSINRQLDSVSEHINTIEQTPGKSYTNVRTKIITTIVEYVVKFALVGVIWAAIQAM